MNRFGYIFFLDRKLNIWKLHFWWLRVQPTPANRCKFRCFPKLTKNDRKITLILFRNCSNLGYGFRKSTLAPGRCITSFDKFRYENKDSRFAHISRTFQKLKNWNRILQTHTLMAKKTRSQNSSYKYAINSVKILLPPENQGKFKLIRKGKGRHQGWKIVKSRPTGLKTSWIVLKPSPIDQE